MTDIASEMSLNIHEKTMYIHMAPEKHKYDWYFISETEATNVICLTGLTKYCFVMAVDA